MKTTSLLLLAAVLSGLACAENTPAPALLAAERQPLECWLGDWSYESTVHPSPLGAAGAAHGTYSVQPILGGQFVEFRGEEHSPAGSLQWTETDGFDPVRGCFFWKSFASDGSRIDATYTLDGPRIAVTGMLFAGSQSYQLRGTVTFADDRQSLTDRREISADGTRWTLLSESRATKLTPALAAPEPSDPRAEVLALEHAWAKAYLERDVAALDRLVADDWFYTDADGKVTSKAQDIADVRSGTYQATEFMMSDLQVRTYGDTAVVTGRQTEIATLAGKDASAVYRVTDVWKRSENGRWQAIASHLSREARP